MRLVAVYVLYYFFFFKQKTAYEMRISDWSSDVCSSDLGLHKAPLAPDTRGRDGARLDEIAHRVGMNLEQPRGFSDGQDMLAHLAHRSAPSAPPHQPRRCASILVTKRRGHRPRKIGRASWRERVCETATTSVGAVNDKKKTTQ